MKQLITLTALLLLTGSTYAQQTPNYVPTNGLVGWWPFNGNANDESGNGNNGTVNGATLTTDRFGNANAAYDFDPANGTIVSFPTASGITDVTVTGWFKAPYQNRYYPRLFFLGEEGGKLAFGFSGNFPSWIGTITGTMYVNASGVLTAGFYDDDAWHSFAVTYDNSTTTLTVYIDGQLENTVTNFSTSIASNTFYLGQDDDDLEGGCAGCGRFEGLIDDVGIWNRALTEEEVTGLYSGQCVAPAQVSLTGLNSSYNLNDGAVQLSASPGGGVFFGAGVSGNTFNPSNAGVGTHSVVYTYVDADGCVASTGLCTTVDLNVNVGGSNIGTDGGIDVYPNPSTGHYLLQLQHMEGIVTYTVYDARGREVESGSMVAAGGTTQRGIDLSGQPKGIYTLQLQTSKGSLTQKLIKE